MLINNQIFCNLENHLDMSSFDALSEQIAYTLAKHRGDFNPSWTTQETLYNRNSMSVRTKADQIMKESSNTISNKEALYAAKLLGTVTLGTHFVVRPDKLYTKKHLSEFTWKQSYDNQFKFLFDWIDAQKCFDDYGRVIFWISEPGQTTALHRDHFDQDLWKNRDPFIWLTGQYPKRLQVMDDVTGESHYSNCRACVFDANNLHASVGHTQFSAWSLRIDGVYNKEWAKRAGIAEYFNIQ